MHKNGEGNLVFYDKYVQLCSLKGVTPTRAAIEMGLSKALPTKWKSNDSTPQGKTLSTIAKYFNVPVSSLIDQDAELTPVDWQVKLAVEAAFWGDDEELTEEDKEELWEDVRAYVEFKTKQRKQKKK